MGFSSSQQRGFESWESTVHMYILFKRFFSYSGFQNIPYIPSFVLEYSVNSVFQYLPYCILYFRIFRVFRYYVPSVRQSTIPPNRVTLTVGVTNFIKVVDANPQQENNFVFLSPFHSTSVIYTPSMLSERVSVSSCSEKETMCFVTRQSPGVSHRMVSLRSSFISKSLSSSD